MSVRLNWSAFVIGMLAATAAAQTTVTTSGGTASSVAAFTGNATIGNSPISFNYKNSAVPTVDIGGNVTLTPASGFSIVPNSGNPATLQLAVHIGNDPTVSMNVITSPSITTGKYDQFFWLFNEDDIPYNATTNPNGDYTRAVSFYQFPSDLIGGCCHLQAVWGINSAGQNYQYFSGNVGIGTSAPGAMLEVDGNLKLTAKSGASITFQDGTTQSTAYTGVTCGGDYADAVDVRGEKKQYGPGDVLVLTADGNGDVVKSSEPYSTLVAGIYSTRPGTVGRRQMTDPKTATREIPMAMVGIVPTKVSAENGPIRRGDLLVTAKLMGYAMKGTDRSRMLGAVVGKAMGSLDSGTGIIEVLVTLQ